jgi:hypothetical protein
MIKFLELSEICSIFTKSLLFIQAKSPVAVKYHQQDREQNNLSRTFWLNTNSLILKTVQWLNEPLADHETTRATSEFIKRSRGR